MSKALEILNMMEQAAAKNKPVKESSQTQTPAAKAMRRFVAKQAAAMQPPVIPEMAKFGFAIPKEYQSQVVEALRQKFNEDEADAEVEPGDDGETINVMSKEDVEEIVMMVLQDLGLIEADDDGAMPPEDGSNSLGGTEGEDDGMTAEGKGKGKKGMMNRQASTMGKGHQKPGKSHLPESLRPHEVNFSDKSSIDQYRNNSSRISSFMEKMGK